MRWLRSAALGLIGLASAGCGGGGTTHVPPPPAPVGALRVAWTLKARDGSTPTCAQLGLTNAKVAIGGPSKTVPCSDGSVLFDGLTPGNYPVFVTLLVGTLSRYDKNTNAMVAEGPETLVQVPFDADPADASKGSIHVSWKIDGAAAGGRCAVVGASTVRISSRPGSISDFDTSVPCADGQTIVARLVPGGYDVLLTLQDANGQALAATSNPTVKVMAGMVAEVPVLTFFTPHPDRAALLGRWTVSGTTAAAGCGPIAAAQLQLSTLNGPMVPFVSTTTTSSCARGHAKIKDLPSGIYAVQFTLLDSAGTFVVTATTVHHITLTTGRTTTVSVDLRQH